MLGLPNKEHCYDVWLVGQFCSTLVWHDFRTDHDDRLYRRNGAYHRMGVARVWSRRKKQSLDTLKHRFARGEIDRAEYEDRRKLLSDT